ncbi:MAG: ATP-binding protein [Candidatus Thermoplasmatota archaeon]|nr:ATP-binding protein [Candidatus Thermoplasmatota archaeon]
MNIDIERFNNALNNEINQLDNSVGDWAAWDDTYLFAGGENNEFPDKNIDNATMTNLRTDVMLYVNTSGNILYERGFDFSDQKILNVSNNLKNYIYKDSVLVNFTELDSSIKGIIRLPEGIILIASRPIITSYREGPIQGSVIWGRYLDTNELNFLSNTTNLSVSTSIYNDQNLPPDFREAAQSIVKNNDIFIQALDNNYIAGYSKIEDIFGKPILLIKITIDRDIYKQGILTIQHFQLIIFILMVILSIILIIFIDKSLLSRLNQLNKQVLDIGKKNDFSKRVSISGKDELNELTNVINETMNIIENTNKTLEIKVFERTKKIDNLLKQKDEFINQLGHDLKNPLNPLVNLLPILEKSETDIKNKEIFNVLIRNANYMKNLVIKTIDLGRLNSPKTRFYFEDVNLYTEFKDVISNNEMIFKEKNIEIKNNIPDNITVQADKLRISELIINLLSNAAKYTKCLGNIMLDAKQDNTYVTVSVKDSGIGMTDEQLEHVFDEFYKADPARHDFDSSGLGLSICKRIVEIHNGEIWVESEGLGEGSTFYFTIPKNKIRNDNVSMEYIYNKIDKIGK